MIMMSCQCIFWTLSVFPYRRHKYLKETIKIGFINLKECKYGLQMLKLRYMT